MKKLNTTKSLLIAYSCSSVGAVLYLLFYSNISAVPVFIVLSRIGTNMSFNITYCSNSRLFPTKFLATTFGIVNLISHLISIGAPLIAEISDPYPFLVFLFNIGVGSIAALFIKELKDYEDVKTDIIK
jgi:hypothetical protein